MTPHKYDPLLSVSPFYDVTLREILLRRYKLQDAVFITQQLKEALRFLASHKIVHTDCSLSNVLVDFGRRRGYVQIKRVVLSDFGNAVDIKHKLYSSRNISFPKHNVICFYGPTTTLCVRPPELYNNTVGFTHYTLEDVYKLDSWSFGILCVLILRHRENKTGRYLSDLVVGKTSLDCLLECVKTLKEANTSFKSLFDPYLSANVLSRSIIV